MAFSSQVTTISARTLLNKETHRFLLLARGTLVAEIFQPSAAKSAPVLPESFS